MVMFQSKWTPIRANGYLANSLDSPLVRVSKLLPPMWALYSFFTPDVLFSES